MWSLSLRLGLAVTGHARCATGPRVSVLCSPRINTASLISVGGLRAMGASTLPPALVVPVLRSNQWYPPPIATDGLMVAVDTSG